MKKKSSKVEFPLLISYFPNIITKYKIFQCWLSFLPKFQQCPLPRDGIITQSLIDEFTIWLQISYQLRAGANKSHGVITCLGGVHSDDEIQVEDGVYSRLTKPRTKNENDSFMQLPRLWVDRAVVSGETITLRLTSIPVPSKKHFSLDCPPPVYHIFLEKAVF